MLGSEEAFFKPERFVWPAAGQPDRPLAGLTMLVVEDSRYASEALRLLCLRSGARIRRADTLKAAMRHLQTYRPGALMVDMGLPDGDGAELIRTLADTAPRVPVLIGISGDPENQETAMQAGADAFLAKPIESLALFQQTVLNALPPQERPRGLRLISNDTVSPDSTALCDDLMHAADVLAHSRDTATLDYIARFLAGVARSAHDPTLEAAAFSLTRDRHDGPRTASNLARISGLVEDRLATARHV